MTPSHGLVNGMAYGVGLTMFMITTSLALMPAAVLKLSPAARKGCSHQVRVQC